MIHYSIGAYECLYFLSFSFVDIFFLIKFKDKKHIADLPVYGHLAVFQECLKILTFGFSTKFCTLKTNLSRVTQGPQFVDFCVVDYFLFDYKRSLKIFIEN